MAAMGILRFVIVAACAACASAETEAPLTPVKEVVSGGARVRGGGMRMDVQVGRTFAQKPASNGAVTAKPNAVVTP
jgi:hypothetical protein